MDYNISGIINIVTSFAQKATDLVVQVLGSLNLAVTPSWARLFNFLLMCIIITLTVRFIVKPLLKVIIFIICGILLIGLFLPVW